MGGDPDALVVPFGIILSAVVVVIFLITGWLGGEQVFRHRVGMIDDRSKTSPPAAGTPLPASAMPADADDRAHPLPFEAHEPKLIDRGS